MRNCSWVAAALLLVLAACGQSTAAAGTVEDASGADGGSDAASDVGETVVDVPSDGCGGDACGNDDVWPDTGESPADADATAPGTDAAQETAAGGVADAAGDALDCAATMADLQAAIDALATAHTDCQHDADCTNVPTSTACQGTCGIGLNVAAVDDFAKALKLLDDKYCAATNYAAQCGYASPKCMAPNPGCVNNHCVYKK